MFDYIYDYASVLVYLRPKRHRYRAIINRDLPAPPSFGCAQIGIMGLVMGLITLFKPRYRAN